MLDSGQATLLVFLKLVSVVEARERHSAGVNLPGVFLKPTIYLRALLRLLMSGLFEVATLLEMPAHQRLRTRESRN